LCANWCKIKQLLGVDWCKMGKQVFFGEFDAQYGGNE